MWGEFWSAFGGIGLALLVACTLLNAAAAVWLAKKSLPRALQVRVERTEADCLGACKVVHEIDAQMSSWKASLEGLIDEAEAQFVRVERKRASAAAAASRAERATGRGNGSGPGGEPGPGASRGERMAWIAGEARKRGM